MATGDDHRLARRLAGEAGELLVALRAAHPDPAGRRQALRDAGDAGAQAFLARELAVARPDDAVLSEEAADSPARLGADRVWIIDPLDGTREFGEVRADWAVHVALWERGREVAAAAVALPDLGVVLATDDPPAPPPPADPPRIVVSRSRPPVQAELVAHAIGGVLVPLGSAGAKAMAVVRGEADLYVHAGGQYEWDSAAPVGVCLAAGLHASRLDGSPLAYNQPDPYLPDLLIGHPGLAARALAALGVGELP